MFEKIFAHIARYWALYTFVLLFAIAIAIAIVSIVAANRKYASYLSNLNDLTSSTRIFILDMKSEMVKSFYATKLNSPKEMSLSSFYRQFPIEDQTRVINWVNAINEPETRAPEYIETDINDRRAKKQFYSLLQLVSVNHERHVIHLESHVMKFIPSSGTKESGHGLSSAKSLFDAIKTNGKKRGASLVFRFAYKRIQDEEKPIDVLVMGQLKNVLSAFVGPKRVLCQLSSNELILTDLHASAKASVVLLTRATLEAINRYFALNGYLTLMGVRIGVVEHYRYRDDIESIVEAAKKQAQEAYLTDETVLYYEPGFVRRETLSESSFSTEVERIIHENKVDVYYRPIYSVEKQRVSAYLMEAKPAHTYFDSMDDLYDYAVRTGDEKELFSMVARNAVPAFLSQANNLNNRLFYPVRMDVKGHILHAFSFSRASNTKEGHIVFLFSESDIKMHVDLGNIEPFIEDLKSIRAKGYEVALLLNGGELQLPNEMYPGFDYFVCGFTFAKHASEMDALIRSQLHSMVEKLLKYNKPIIASDLQGWSSVELVIRSGIRFISSDSFAPYDKMVLPAPAKSLRRIKDIR